MIILFKCKYIASQLGQLQIYTDIHGRKFMTERDITQSPVLESTLLTQRLIGACKVWTKSRYRILAGASEHTLGEQFQFSSSSEKVYWTHAVSQKYPGFSVGNCIHDFRLSHNPKKPYISHSTREFLGSSRLKHGFPIYEGQGSILLKDCVTKRKFTLS